MEAEMSLSKMQKRVHAWVEGNGGYWEELALLARLTEEVGELAREYNHRHGPKKKKASEAPVQLEEEMADVLWILVCMANQQGIDLESAFEQTMRKIEYRDKGRFTAPEGA
jgi:NTP pyrophosphatase (non-canonical NTP hydrolase)